jgi:hypothetical protein
MSLIIQLTDTALTFQANCLFFKDLEIFRTAAENTPLFFDFMLM